MPMVLITRSKAIRQSRQAHFQIVDVVAAMRPLTKQSPTDRGRIEHSDAGSQCAFVSWPKSVPGRLHLELPEERCRGGSGRRCAGAGPRNRASGPIAQDAIKRAADLIWRQTFRC